MESATNSNVITDGNKSLLHDHPAPKGCDITNWDAQSQAELSRMENYINEMMIVGYTLHSVIPTIFDGNVDVFVVILVR